LTGQSERPVCGGPLQVSPSREISFHSTDSLPGRQLSDEISPLVAAVIAAGGIIQCRAFVWNPEERAFEVSQAVFPELYDGERRKRRLPCGHRFYPDCLREQEARLSEWLIHTFKGDGWFITTTFKTYLSDLRAWGLQGRFLSRLNQSYQAVPGAELLRSITSVEWQKREVIHFHSLIFGRQLGQLSRRRWEDRWRSMSGGYCANYDAKDKAAPYLAKHTIKNRTESNLQYGGSWRGITPPRSVSRCCAKTARAVTLQGSEFGRPGCLRSQGLTG